jgi:predicted enzyme related to lactoylglutathione lyase
VALHAGGAGADAPTGLGFEVDDLDGAVSAVAAAGGRVIAEPRERPEERIRLAEVADSEGNRIAVAQTLG